MDCTGSLSGAGRGRGRQRGSGEARFIHVQNFDTQSCPAQYLLPGRQGRHAIHIRQSFECDRLKSGPLGKEPAGGINSRLSLQFSTLAANASPITIYLLAMGLAAQTFHMTEHFGQLYQHAILGWSIKASAGIVYFLNLEWNHFTFNLLYLLLLGYSFVALKFYRRDSLASQVQWAAWAFTIAFIVQIYHTFEHTVRINQFLSTGCTPCPGILGRYVDGIYLHFVLNSMVYVLPLAAFLGYGFHRRIRASYTDNALGLAGPADVGGRQLRRVDLSLVRATILFFSAYLVIGATILEASHIIAGFPQLYQHAIGSIIPNSAWTDLSIDLTYLVVIGLVFISLRLFIFEGLTGLKKFAAYSFATSFFVSVYLVTDDLVRILQYAATSCSSCSGIFGTVIDNAHQHLGLDLLVLIGPITTLFAFRYYSLLSPRMIGRKLSRGGKGGKVTSRARH